MEEKERVKQEKIRLKEGHKQQFGKKRQEKAELAAEKKRQKEAKGIKERKHTQGTKKTAAKQGLEKSPSFTEKEIKLFKPRFANGYDLTTDKRYNTWLKTKCPGMDDGVQEADLSVHKEASSGTTS